MAAGFTLWREALSGSKSGEHPLLSDERRSEQPPGDLLNVDT